jgi:hypothetical protein
MPAPTMCPVQNLDGKRVCNLSGDGRMIEIRLRGCVTQVWTNSAFYGIIGI